MAAALSAGRPRGEAASPEPYRVAVVDDSVVIRGLIARWLEEDPAIDIVAKFANGRQAVDGILACRAEVVILDIEMPEMDGLTALPELLKVVPGLKIIMSSTLTLRNADISLRALSMGAVDYVPKPETVVGVSMSEQFRMEITEKVKTFAELSRRENPVLVAEPPAVPVRNERVRTKPTEAYPPDRDRRRPHTPRPERAAEPPERAKPPSATGRADQPERSETPKAEPRQRTTSRVRTDASRRSAPAPTPSTRAEQLDPVGSKPITLVPATGITPQVLAIGCSTGGPNALMRLFGDLRGRVGVPVLITQHMPPMFTSILAEHLTKAARMPAKEGEDGETVRGGQIYVAPGDFHMEVVQRGSDRILKLNKNPPENFCRPAVDPLFRSIARVYGNKALCLVLTGMGHDGRAGGQEIVRAGSTLVAQDKASSVVWGMPGAVAAAGLCTAVVPIERMGAAVERFLSGGSP